MGVLIKCKPHKYMLRVCKKKTLETSPNGRSGYLGLLEGNSFRPTFHCGKQIIFSNASPGSILSHRPGFIVCTHVVTIIAEILIDK
jgi:hypothetical protein